MDPDILTPIKLTCPGLIVVGGPTATGKSALALALAQGLGCPILSADSRQVYCGFDIGTAKPTVAEQAQAPHYLIDLCSPRDILTLAEYQAQAQGLIARFHRQGQTPILVGGTGLYIRAITEGLQIPRVPPQWELRSQLQSLGQLQSYQWLQQVDPAAAVQIHPHDQVRTLRALEVFYATGRPLSQQQGTQIPSYPILQLGLDLADSDQRLTRIRQRTDQMLAQGWLSEVQTLMSTYGEDLPLLETLGYRELKQHLQGDLSLLEARNRIILRTRQFAKRQRTWFRAIPQMQWFEATDTSLLNQVGTAIETFLATCVSYSPCS
ncbi:tRNA (adenosine(37)-N6)-dimethylallyltransferase MiaA [Synechococcales cyanobacterium C]|uniref:tRNA dimethylallyltransferase n=1 Tax=Petrachloros mirabilis ULC683 TaxID=2781853 RepID=A0A8K1ZYK5_9CYAN|nr:tRNA (adenosine(37)-N6)-dimethylallyltransferase MiaA [Petrachloros mirabilis]NCJ06371.1 tRNA (adenosine(37)-N6)-dimethylallyltransferase MiaA [Petrachloros mirabilis ULC683]